MDKKILKYLEFIKEKKIKQVDGARLIGKSVRQVQRMLKKYLTGGFKALIHGNRGKASQRRIPREVRVKIIELYKTRYFQFNITHFTEKLAENHDIYLCKDTVRSIINNLKLPQKKNKKNIYKRRERKANFGDMVQMDGSLHKWFGNDYSTLMAIIDDCTGVVELHFCAQECFECCVKVTKNYINKYGVPNSFYFDRGKVFRVNNYNKDKYETRPLTQFEKILEKLGAQSIHARSPQAKGRVKRLFGTLQDRLVAELADRQINTIDAANQFLNDYFIVYFNSKFTVAGNFTNVHLDKPANIDQIMQKQYKRRLNNDQTVCLKNKIYLIKDSLQPGVVISINKDFSGNLTLFCGKIKLSFKLIDTKIKPVSPKKEVKNIYHKPSSNHPWRGTDFTSPKKAT